MDILLLFTSYTYDLPATVNLSGNACPYSLKMIACQLLLEISTFLRETFQYLPDRFYVIFYRSKQSY